MHVFFFFLFENSKSLKSLKSKPFRNPHGNFSFSFFLFFVQNKKLNSKNEKTESMYVSFSRIFSRKSFESELPKTPGGVFSF